MSKEYYERVAVMGQFIINCVNEFSPDISLQDNMKSAIALGPNPYRPEIEDDGSLLLEFAYGLPSRFYTPLGGFEFCGEGVVREGKNEIGARIVAELISRFDLEEVIPAGKAGGGLHLGPILTVGKDLNGNPFTTPEITEMPEAKSYDDEIDFDERSMRWNEVRPDLEKVRSLAKEASFES